MEPKTYTKRKKLSVKALKAGHIEYGIVYSLRANAKGGYMVRYGSNVYHARTIEGARLIIKHENQLTTQQTAQGN